MHDATMIVLVLLVVSLTVWAVLSVFRTRGLRESNDFLHEAHHESQDLRIEAERRASAAETELAFVRQSLVQTLQRPAVAVLTEENIQQLGALIQSFMVKPNAMN